MDQFNSQTSTVTWCFKTIVTVHLSQKGLKELCDKNSMLVGKNEQHRRKTIKTQHLNNMQEQTASTVHIPEKLKAEACSCKVINL